MMQILLKDIRSIEDLPLEKPDWVEEKRWNSIHRMKTEADKKRSFASAYLLDCMCRDVGITNPVYEYTAKGKAFLESVECAFNLSHSGDWVVLAYHKTEEPIGVDIQRVRLMREGMETRILHEKEKGQIRGNVNEDARYLNRLWAIKESFVKMTGEGLARDFRSVYVDFEEETVTTEDGVHAKFSVWEWKNDYFLSVCSEKTEECEINEIS